MKKIAIIIINIALGLLFVYGGVKKFIPRERPKTEQKVELSEEKKAQIAKIRGLIGGLKQTGYFWEFLGVCEIVFGLMLITQYFSLLGAVMLLPITLNILLFHVFLEPDDLGELAMTGLYTLMNVLIIAYDYRKLKAVFL